MIFAGKKLRNALEKTSVLPNPSLRFSFDTEKELFRRKSDHEPLLSYRLKGNFRLPLIETSLILTAACIGLCMLKKKIKK